MRLTACRMRCRGCDHHFEAELLTDCSVYLFTAALREMRCPECGAGYESLDMCGGGDDSG